MNTPISIEVVRTEIISLSSMSLASAQPIVSSLKKQGYDVTLTNINSSEDLAALIARKPDVVFLGMMYIVDSTDPTHRIWISEALEAAGIAHTGSPRSAHELELNKDKAKQRVLDHGLATAQFRIVDIGQLYAEQRAGLEYPLFVKPLSGGGGQGVDEYSIVRTLEQLNDKISWLHRHHKVNILIEHYLEGREFSVAIIRDHNSNELTAMPLELIAPKDSNGERMLSNSVKSLNQDKAIAVTDPSEQTLLGNFALTIFRILGARDYGRIDIRLDGNGTPHFLEANLIPSLIANYGSFPKAYEQYRDGTHDDMIDTIVQLAAERTNKLPSVI